VHTKPHLEIDADDVVCSHGATVGALDEDQLFYLRARGIPEELAHTMLTYAFLESIVDRVSHEPTRTRMREALLARVPRGEEIREVT
jgi:Fe-S cluster assembly protein SufD